MGEIKSTLDLVMERTRHLSLSPEEKARQQRSDFEKRLQGVLQQYADGVLSQDALRDRITQLQTEFNVHDHQLVVEALFRRIDPNQDNERWLDLIKRFAPASLDPLREMLSAYEEQRTRLIETSEKRLLEQFAQSQGIAGSAVVPNPEKDPVYQDSSTALHREMQARIDALSHSTDSTERL